MMNDELECDLYRVWVMGTLVTRSRTKNQRIFTDIFPTFVASNFPVVF